MIRQSIVLTVSCLLLVESFAAAAAVNGLLFFGESPLFFSLADFPASFAAAAADEAVEIEQVTVSLGRLY